MPNNNSLKKRDPMLDLDPVYADADLGYVDGYYGGAAPEGGEKQQLFKIFRVLRKYWVLILGLTLLATALVIVYEAQKPDYYRAQVRIQVDNEVNPAAGGKTGGSVIVNPGSDPAYFTTQLQILEGSGLLRRVVKTLDLENNQEFFRVSKDQKPTVWENVKRMFGQGAPPPPKGSRTEAANNKINLKTDTGADLDSQAETLAPYVGFIKNNLEVAPVQDSRTANKITRLIEVEYTHHDPAMATKIVNAIADVYVLQNLELKVQTNTNASDFLQKRVAELQTQIRLGEERLINYAKNNQILSLDSNQNTVVQRLADLNNKLSQAESERVNTETAYRAALQNPQFNSATENKDARTTGLESQLLTLRQQLTQLKTQYTDEWYEVKNVRQQIANIEQELEKSRKKATSTELGALEQAYRQAASKENELRRYFNEQRGAVLNQNEAAINYRIIQQEIDTNKSLLENLLQRSRETEVILNGTPNNVYVVDRALAPRAPAGPNRTKNVFVAFFASMLAGIGIAFLLNWLDDKIRATDNLEGTLGIPVIGMIPRSLKNLSMNRLLPAKLRNRSKKPQYDLESFEKPLVAEAFHQLRTSLLFSTAGGAPQTILVTSGQPSEGKTVTSLNLAKSLAQLGNKVLLVDADMRSPKMHFINNRSNAKGLSNLLTMKNADQAAISDVVQHDLEKNLDLLTSGPQVPNPTNLLSSGEMRSLLHHFSATYSHIIIDSPPLLFFADSVILSTKVDAVMLIARNNHSTQEIVMQAKRKLQDVRANIVGLVLNDIVQNDYQYHNYTYYQQLEEPEVVESDGSSMLHLNK